MGSCQIWMCDVVVGKCASIAQWLEHWSSKPGVVSSILTGGKRFTTYFWHTTDCLSFGHQNKIAFVRVCVQTA